MNPITLILLTVVCAILSGAVHWIGRSRNWTTPRRLGRNRFPDPPTSEGGGALLLGFLLCLTVSYRYLDEDFLLARSEMISHHIGLGLGLLWVWGLGRWGDGRRNAHGWTLLALGIAAGVAAAFGFSIRQLRWGGAEYDLGALAIPVTILWFVVVAEFFRLFEGLDGLLCLLAILAVGLQLAVLSPEEGYARLLCLSTLPPLIGVLPWRIYPARMELRGVGAFLPGFAIGAITMVGREKAFTTKAILLPGFVLICVISLFALWLLEQNLFLPKKKKRLS